MEQRQIKFRVWTGSQMEYKVLVGQLGAFYVQGLDPNDSACISPMNTKYSDETPIMQFTGLLDSTGKEVYHGDILQGTKNKYQVQWQKEEARFFLAPITGVNWKFMDECSSYKVIGNIYEHPELLKP